MPERSEDGGIVMRNPWAYPTPTPPLQKEGTKELRHAELVSASHSVILRCQRHSPIRCWYNFKASLRAAKNLKNNKVQLIVPYKTYTYHSK